MTINNINNTASSMAIGNLGLAVNTLSSSNTNGNIVLSPNGTGLVSMAGAYTFPRIDGSANFVLKTDGSGVVSWAADSSAVFAWTVITANTQAMVAENGYISNNATQAVVYTLPATAAVGDGFEVNAIDAFGWQIAQNAGQTIRIGNTATTSGTGGSLASTANGDWVRLVCTVANTAFIASVQQGNITVV
jgi:hypothetical protein